MADSNGVTAGTPSWVDLGSPDVDASVKFYGELFGWTADEGSLEFGGAGSMAILQDPTGAVFGLWQPGQHKGSEVFNTPVSLTWNELSTRDPEAAKRFYSSVFGWDPHTNGEGAQAYTEWQLGGKSVGGMMQTPPQVPAQVPPHWLSYFTVADCDATVAKAQSLGGSVMMPKTTIPQGTFAVLADPAGAAFAVIQPA